MNSEVLMGVKGRIVWPVLVLAALLSGILFTQQEWVGCSHVLPDQYMDLDFIPDQRDPKTVFQDTPFMSSSLFACRVEFESSETFFPFFAGDSPCFEPHSKAVLRI